MFSELVAIQSIQNNLQLFKWVTPNKTANFRCFVCGDSKTNQRKARGYLIAFKDTFFYKCHKCGYSQSLGYFLKEYFPLAFQQYKLEKLRENSTTVEIQRPTLEVPKEAIKRPSGTISIADLPESHPAVKYVSGRLIPESEWNRIGYTDNFAEYVVKTSGIQKYKRLPKDKRILLELKDESGKVFGVQGRSLEPDAKLRYVTLKFDDSRSKLYGLENLNTTQPIVVVEGGIDSMFLPNAIAVCGGDVSLSLEFLKGKDVTVALDNEPRSKDTISRMSKAIEMGYKVCFWKLDSNLKDINEMVKSGINKETVYQHILDNSLSGYKAKAELAFWKKI
jgi:DNA primase